MVGGQAVGAEGRRYGRGGVTQEETEQRKGKERGRGVGSAHQTEQRDANSTSTVEVDATLAYPTCIATAADEGPEHARDPAWDTL